MTTVEPRRTGTAEPRDRVAADETVGIRMTVNGTETTVTVPPRAHLGDVLREQLGLTGTHLGCEHGVCGMCTVLVDGEAARACLLFAVQCEGAEIVTVEGLGTPEDQHPLQQAFSAHHALQCGFCTPGMLMSSYDLLSNTPEVESEELPEQMSGVLCRCTGYRGILAAVDDVRQSHPDGVPGPRACGARTLVGRGTGGGSGAGAPAEDVPAAALAQEVRLPSGPPSAVVDVTSALRQPVERNAEPAGEIGRPAFPTGPRIHHPGQVGAVGRGDETPRRPVQKPVLDVEQPGGRIPHLRLVLLQPEHLGRRVHAVVGGRAVGDARPGVQLVEPVAGERGKSPVHGARQGAGPLVQPDDGPAQGAPRLLDRNDAAHLRAEDGGRGARG